MGVFIQFPKEEWDSLGRSGTGNDNLAKRNGEVNRDVGGVPSHIANPLSTRGEAAFVLATGATDWERDWTKRLEKTYGVDCVMPVHEPPRWCDRKTVQVKTHINPYELDKGYFFTDVDRNGKQLPLAADIGVQCQPVVDRPYAIEIVRYCLRDEYNSSTRTKDFGYGERRVLRYQDMHLVTVLLR